MEEAARRWKRAFRQQKAENKELRLKHAAEIEDIQQQRNTFRAQCANHRATQADLQSQIDELNCQLVDLKRAVSRGRKGPAGARPSRRNSTTTVSETMPGQDTTFGVEEHNGEQSDRETVLKDRRSKIYDARSASPMVQTVEDSPMIQCKIGPTNIKREPPPKLEKSPSRIPKRETVHKAPIEIIEIDDDDDEAVPSVQEVRKTLKRPLNSPINPPSIRQFAPSIPIDETKASPSAQRQVIVPPEVFDTPYPVTETAGSNSPPSGEEIQPSVDRIAKSESLDEKKPFKRRKVEKHEDESQNLNDGPGDVAPPARVDDTGDRSVLAAEIFASYIGTARVGNIQPPPERYTFKRQCLQESFGGNRFGFAQIISDPTSAPNSTRKRQCCFPLPEMNPCLPQAPGEPGFLFASRHDTVHNPPWCIFIRTRSEDGTRWEYVGQYTSVICGQISAQQFSRLSEKTKAKWADLIYESRRLDVYVSMRARIALRKHGIAVSDDSTAQEMSMIRKGGKGRGKGLAVTMDEIVDAFCRGDEAIDIIRLECVGYDHGFMKAVMDKHRVWDAPDARALRVQKSVDRKARRQRLADQQASRVGGATGLASDSEAEGEPYRMTRLHRREREADDASDDPFSGSLSELTDSDMESDCVIVE